MKGYERFEVMTTFFLTLAVFVVAVASMSVGVLVGRRRLRGTCGGLAGLQGENGPLGCDACTNPLGPCQSDEPNGVETSANSRQLSTEKTPAYDEA